jgi:enoyl-CoA hydratase
MSEEFLLVEIRNSVAWLTINRPDKRNALSQEVLASLLDTVRALSTDESIRCLVVTGGPKVFAAGADITQIRGVSPVEMNRRYEWQRYLWDAIETFPKPTIAAVAGYALGGGCELALCCDFRIVATTAVFGLPEVKIGLMPGAGGTQRLTRLVGPSKAKELIFFGRMVRADEAEAIGLANKVVSSEDLFQEAENWAVELAKGPTFSLQMAKTAINTAGDLPLPTAVRVERLAFSSLFGSRDHIEGVDAFLEKRDPKFVGE